MSTINKVEWEQTSCDFCGTWEGDPALQGYDRLQNLPGKFRVVRCPQCGLLRQNPRPTLDTIGFYYPPDYESYLTAIEDEKSQIGRAVRRYGMWKRTRLIERLQPEGRLLDVGCATGLFLAELQRTGRWDVMGIEPSGDAASYARERFGLQVFHGPLEEFHIGNERFDVITLWNVLEHLHTPIQALRRVTAFLRPGGWAVFTIPNLESFDARVFRDAWLGWDLPRHLYWFPQQNLSQIFQATGLIIRGKCCFVGGHDSVGLSLKFWLDEHLRSSPRTRAILLRIYNSLPSRVVLSPLWWTIGKARRLPLITIMAQKNDTL